MARKAMAPKKSKTIPSSRLSTGSSYERCQFCGKNIARALVSFHMQEIHALLLEGSPAEIGRNGPSESQPLGPPTALTENDLSADNEGAAGTQPHRVNGPLAASLAGGMGSAASGHQNRSWTNRGLDYRQAGRADGDFESAAKEGADHREAAESQGVVEIGPISPPKTGYFGTEGEKTSQDTVAVPMNKSPETQWDETGESSKQGLAELAGNGTDSVERNGMLSAERLAVAHHSEKGRGPASTGQAIGEHVWNPHSAEQNAVERWLGGMPPAVEVGKEGPPPPAPAEQSCAARLSAFPLAERVSRGPGPGAPSSREEALKGALRLLSEKYRSLLDKSRADADAASQREHTLLHEIEQLRAEAHPPKGEERVSEAGNVQKRFLSEVEHLKAALQSSESVRLEAEQARAAMKERHLNEVAELAKGREAAETSWRADVAAVEAAAEARGREVGAAQVQLEVEPLLRSRDERIGCLEQQSTKLRDIMYRLGLDVGPAWNGLEDRPGANGLSNVAAARGSRKGRGACRLAPHWLAGKPPSDRDRTHEARRGTGSALGEPGLRNARPATGGATPGIQGPQVPSGKGWAEGAGEFVVIEHDCGKAVAQLQNADVAAQSVLHQGGGRVSARKEGGNHRGAARRLFGEKRGRELGNQGQGLGFPSSVEQPGEPIARQEQTLPAKAEAGGSVPDTLTEKGSRPGLRAESQAQGRGRSQPMAAEDSDDSFVAGTPDTQEANPDVFSKQMPPGTGGDHNLPHEQAGEPGPSQEKPLEAVGHLLSTFFEDAEAAVDGMVGNEADNGTAGGGQGSGERGRDKLGTPSVKEALGGEGLGKREVREDAPLTAAWGRAGPETANERPEGQPGGSLIRCPSAFPEVRVCLGIGERGEELGERAIAEGGSERRGGRGQPGEVDLRHALGLGVREHTKREGGQEGREEDEAVLIRGLKRRASELGSPRRKRATWQVLSEEEEGGGPGQGGAWRQKPVLPVEAVGGSLKGSGSGQERHAGMYSSAKDRPRGSIGKRGVEDGGSHRVRVKEEREGGDEPPTRGQGKRKRGARRAVESEEEWEAGQEEEGEGLAEEGCKEEEEQIEAWDSGGEEDGGLIGRRGRGGTKAGSTRRRLVRKGGRQQGIRGRVEREMEMEREESEEIEEIREGEFRRGLKRLRRSTENAGRGRGGRGEATGGKEAKGPCGPRRSARLRGREGEEETEGGGGEGDRAREGSEEDQEEEDESHKIYNLAKEEEEEEDNDEDDSDRGSLKDFIVDDEEEEEEGVSDQEDGQEGEGSGWVAGSGDGEEGSASDGDWGFDREVGRRWSDEELDERTLQFEFQGDLQTALARSDVLCLRALAALYRQQSDEEKETRSARHTNRRGFDKLEAKRASELAQRVLDGDPMGEIKRKPSELHPADRQFCRKVAMKHAGQLFAILQNGEDRHFPFR